MFRRKEEGFDTTGETKIQTSASSDAEGTSAGGATSAARPAAPANTNTATPSAPQASQPVRQSGAPVYRPAGSGSARPSAAATAPASAPSTATPARANERVLTVGPDILLKGEIATCDRLLIQGSVDAQLKDVHTVEIDEEGSFKGSAKIENAEISGLFEGDLEVRGRLLIQSTGKVRGSITYGEIEIQSGGELSGTISMGASAGRKSESNQKKAA